MKIAIQAADLDNGRIDGTRVYLLNVLKYLGKLSEKDEFFIYHKKSFNPELTPPNFSNYTIKKVSAPFLWTQTGFAWNIRKDKIETLWMPMHNIPFFRRKGMKTIVTIHDLAFKKLPETFPKKDLFKLNFLTDLAVKKADKIIAVSASTKKDILKFYPNISSESVKVIYHGFDAELFQKNFSEDKISEVLKNHELKAKSYILYVGAIQPRKNLKTLIRAFEIFKEENADSNLKLVLSGGKAWSWKETMEVLEKSPQKDNIILTDKVPFDELAVLYRNASLFVFPSLYEGFGIPVLEAFASKIPVIVSENSSLPEVGGDGAEYFNGSDAKDLSFKIKKILEDEALRDEMIRKGEEQLKKFSWEKCARETLEFLKS